MFALRNVVSDSNPLPRPLIPLVCTLLLFVMSQLVLALPIGGILNVKPQVTVQSANKHGWVSVSERYKLMYGDAIRTDATGQARVLFNNGTDIRLGAKTEIKVIAPAEADQPLVIRLIAGAKGILVQAQGPTVIQSAACNAAVRGTKFLFQVADTEQTTLTVLEGQVEFYNAQGRVMVLANQQSTAQHGAAPTAPREVADVTGLISWTTDITNLPLEYEMPTTPDAQLAPALTAMARGDYATARTALQQQADTAQRNTLLGLLELRDGHPDVAVTELNKATTQDATLYQTEALLALAYLTLNQLPAADTAAQRAITLQPKSAQSQATLALVQFYQGDSYACTTAKRAITLDPYSPFALVTQGRIFLAQGRVDEARNAFQQAKAQAPDLPIIETELGQTYLRLGLIPKAEAAFRRALAGQVISPDARTGLGICLQTQGKTVEAKAEYQLALTLNPRHAGAHVNLAALEMEQGNLANAEAELRQAEAEQPEHGLLYAKLAQLSLYRQRVFEAQTYARRAVTLLPRSAIAHYQLGQVCQEQGRLMQARQEYRLAATLDPQYAPARYALGVVRGILETGMDIAHPLGAVDAATQGSPGQTLNLQNLQAPGMEDRIQAVIADPTVVRVASRAYGDTQIDGLLGEEHTTRADLSYLHETRDRGSVIGVTAAQSTTDGVRANADRMDEQFGVNYGWQAPDHRFGLFALAQFERSIFGADINATTKPFDQYLRANYETPYLLFGANRQWDSQQQTSLLVVSQRPYKVARDSSDQSSVTQHIDLQHAEVRHDVQWTNQLLSIGMGLGHASAVDDTFFPSPFPPDIPDIISRIDQEVEWQEAYIHDALQLSRQFALIGEVRVNRLIETDTVTSVSPPFPADVTHTDTYVALPSLILSAQLTARDGLRLRTQGEYGGIDGFHMLTPTDVFLFPVNNLSYLSFGGRGQSYALEYDHNFSDTSTLWIGAIQQQMRDAQNADVEVLDHFTYRALETRFETVLTPTTTCFASLVFMESSGVVQYAGTPLPSGELSDIPRFTGEVGVQYLNTRGWFLQPSWGYEGSRFQGYVPGFPDLPRTRIGGFGIGNLRAGKRWGLHTSCYIEVENLFDRRYTVLSQTTEHLVPGRLLRVGITQRF